MIYFINCHIDSVVIGQDTRSKVSFNDNKIIDLVVLGDAQNDESHRLLEALGGTLPPSDE